MTHAPPSEFGQRCPPGPWGLSIRLAQHCPTNWIGQQIAQVIRRVVIAFAPLPLDLTVEGCRMRCQLTDNCSENKFAFMPWRFDSAERRILRESLPSDGVFVDVGANVGIYSLTAARALGASGRVIALEPNPPTYARLCFNLQASRGGCESWPRVDAIPMGVADSEISIDLQVDEHNLGASSIVPTTDKPRRTVRIHCRPLLDILAEQAVSHIDVLKIDIEGAEDIALMPFLAAAPASQLPRVLIIENSEQRWKHALPGALRRSGYSAILRTRMNTVYRLADATRPASRIPDPAS
ncbi:MAG: FkbM family methyltransferase [Opitutaceae bacterium]|nr:FkbM family methyltransferase [Opitutaceae bacterium]